MSDFKAKMHQNPKFGPRWGAYSAPPDPLAGFKEPTSKERGGEGRGREGREVTRGEGGDRSVVESKKILKIDPATTVRLEFDYNDRPTTI